MSAKNRSAKAGKSIVPQSAPTKEPDTQPEDDGGNVALMEAPPNGLSGLTDEELELMALELKDFGLEAFLPDFQFTTENVQPIIPGDGNPGRATADQQRIVDRARLMSDVPEWRNQFTYIAHRGNSKLQVQFPGHGARTVIPDPRTPDVRIPVPALTGKFAYYSYDSRISEKMGIFCILDMPEVSHLGEFDPFYLKLLMESPSNEAYGKRCRLVDELRPMLEAKVEAIEAAYRADQLASAPMSPRLLKTGKSASMVELMRKAQASREQLADKAPLTA